MRTFYAHKRRSRLDEQPRVDVAAFYGSWLEPYIFSCTPCSFRLQVTAVQGIGIGRRET